MSQSHADTLGYCRWCGARVGTDTLRDLKSLKEFHIGAACQCCQDQMFLGVGDEGPPVSHRIRHGVVVGAVCPDAPTAPHEVALVPFLFVVALRRFVWETRHIVRAGFGPEPGDPWVELEPMREAWADLNVRVLCVPSCANPLLSNGFADRDLVIGLDESTLRVAAKLYPTARPPALVSLGTELPWQAAFGAPLLPLAPFLRAHVPDLAPGPADARCGSSLRQCAVVARLLSLPATRGRDAGQTAFDLLLLAHSARFEESIRGRSRRVS